MMIFHFFSKMYRFILLRLYRRLKNVENFLKKVKIGIFKKNNDKKYNIIMFNRVQLSDF